MTITINFPVLIAQKINFKTNTKFQAKTIQLENIHIIVVMIILSKII